MELNQVLIPMFAIAGFLIIAFFAIFVEHRQRMLMIKKGINPDILNQYGYSGLKSGLFFTFVSLAVLISTKGVNLYGLPWYAPGGILLAIGLARLSYYILRGRYEKHRLFQTAILNNQQRITR